MRIGNFEIIAKLGEGGMGEVYKGIDIMLNRPVAVKALRPELAARRDVVERFHSEAVALAKLNHPNIATLYSFFQEGGRYYMVLEFVAGEPLDKLIARYHTLPWLDAVHLACQALAGLDHAHQAGIVHRDIKPGNLMLTGDLQIKLMDFGIARILQTSRMTKTGHLIGTLEYMSPEQIQGQEVDPRSDLYSLGIVLYEMLSGRLPFQPTTDYELIKQQVESPPLPLTKVSADIPTRLNASVMKALAKMPDQRFDNARDFANELAEIADAASGQAERMMLIPVMKEIEPQDMAPAIAMSIPQGSRADSGPRVHDQKDIPGRSVLAEKIRQYPGIALSILLLMIALVIVGMAWYRQARTIVNLPSTTQPYYSPAPEFGQKLEPPNPPPVPEPKAERQNSSPTQKPSFEGSSTSPNENLGSQASPTVTLDSSLPPVKKHFPEKSTKRKSVRKKAPKRKLATPSPDRIRSPQGWEIRK